MTIRTFPPGLLHPANRSLAITRRLPWLAAAMFALSTLFAPAAVTHRWSFSEGTGTNILDTIGAAHGSVVVIGTTNDFSWVPGMVRLAGGAKGQADYVQLPSNLLSGLTNMTIELWATPRAGQAWSRIFDFGSGTGPTAGTFFLSFNRGSTSLNQQRFEFNNPVTWRVDTGVATTVSNQYHYVVTWSASGLVQWYRDGVLEASADTAGASLADVDDTVLWLGRSQYADNTATADYNEVRLYSHVMSPVEINFSRTNGPDNLVIPPQQASNLTITTNANPRSLVLSWTSGTPSGPGSLVVMRAGQPTSAQPVPGNTYTASPVFGNGQDLGDGNYVVFNNFSSSTVTVTNLIPGVLYYATVYSYTTSGAISTRVYNLADPPSASHIAPGAVESIELQVPAQMVIDSSSQATVLADFGGGIITDVTASATYSSGNTNVITVTPGGVLQAINYGQSLITASYQGKQDSNIVTVLNPLTNNLIHRYSFTSDASDSVGAAHGTLQGGAIIVSNEVVLDGAGSYVDLPNDLFLSFDSITIETWVTDVGSGGWARIFDFGNSVGGEDAQGGGTQYMFLSLPAGAGNLRGAYSLNGGGANEQLLQWVGGRPPVGQKAHIVWTSDGPSHVGRLYVDGVQVGVNSNMTLRPMDLGSTLNNWLGRAQYNDPYFNGSYDEFRIYNVALPPSIIAMNFQNGPDGLVVAPPVAVNDSMTLNPGAMALIPVLQNDQGLQINPASVTIISGPAAGTAQVKPGGKILYTHNGGIATADDFKYRVSNTLGDTSNIAVVSLTISPDLRLENTTMTVPLTPPPVGYRVVDAFPGNLFFEDCVAVRSRPDNSNQLFVVERRGMISYIPDISSPTPTRQVLLNITDQVSFDNAAEGELGMLGMAFHPGFATNGYFFVYYMAPAGPGAQFDRLSRFTANPTTLAVDTNSQQIILNVLDDPNGYNNHNAGDVHFGPDGYLYLSMGDEGDQYNQQQNAQRIDKDFYSGLLRIDVDKRPGSLEPTPHVAVPTNGLGQAFYSIPPDNPFLGVTNFYGAPVDTNALRAEFYAVGLRHPWRFSIDTNGEIWVGDVGQDRYEEVDVIVPGGNYGWSYYEGVHLARDFYPGPQTILTNPPAGLLDPLWEYPHMQIGGGDPQYKGNSISGGVIYRGDRLPELNGAYIFGDFESANLWALWRTNGSVIVQRLAGDSGMAAYGIDPLNGDVLIANYLENKIKRLVRTDAVNSTFPAKLSDTGIFADLATLSPNPGIVNYEPIVAFWSDYAIKRRWFSVPDLTNTITFAPDQNWTFPTGTKWIKHFDLETVRGNPATKKRLETRVLVKNDTGTYGVSYHWNDAGTEAFLVGDGGTNFTVTVQDGTNVFEQPWEIPSRAACLICHTPVAGHALSFNTRELNQTATMNGHIGNQITSLSQAGYFDSPVANAHTLPAFAHANDLNASLEYRVRSYLSVNCVQCHQPGGTGASTWDARANITLSQTLLINGELDNNGGNPANKLVVPGNTNLSVLLKRIKGDGFSRMPPLATHQLDLGAIALVAAWISGDTNRQTFAEWQISHFGSTNNPLAAAGANPDGDSANNYAEYLTGTDPQNSASVWKLTISAGGGLVNVSYPRVANLGVIVDTSFDLQNWEPWNVPGNQPLFTPGGGMTLLQGQLLDTQYFRARLIEP